MDYLSNKKSLIKMIKSNAQQLYGQPDTASDCLEDTEEGITQYSIQHSINLDPNGYNSIFDRLLIKHGILAGYKYLKTDDGKIRPVTVQDTENIIKEFLKKITLSKSKYQNALNHYIEDLIEYNHGHYNPRVFNPKQLKVDKKLIKKYKPA